MTTLIALATFLFSLSSTAMAEGVAETSPPPPNPRHRITAPPPAVTPYLGSCRSANNMFQLSYGTEGSFNLARITAIGTSDSVPLTFAGAVIPSVMTGPFAEVTGLYFPADRQSTIQDNVVHEARLQIRGIEGSNAASFFASPARRTELTKPFKCTFIQMARTN